MLKPIKIEFVNHNECRNASVGDYGEDEHGVWFKIANDLGTDARTVACMIHELWEKFRNDQLGISDKSVDDFDEAHMDDDDPGSLLDAPYHKTHMESDALERMCIIMAGDDWTEYDNAVNNLSWE
jgi:hypothetical protein